MAALLDTGTAVDDVGKDFWKLSSRGILSYPVSLQLQCLLYIIGNLYHGSKLIPGLGLLPRQLRIKLLLLLPAIDVCKLEGTSVTRDISMNEIWERLYKERAPLKKFHIYKQSYNMVDSPIEWQERKGLDCSWKDAYFIFLFTCEQYHYCLPHDNVLCSCQYFLSLDLLYSVYKLNDTNASVTPEVYQCFPIEDGLMNIHSIHQYSHRCKCIPRLVPGYYFLRFVAPSIVAKIHYKLSLIPYWDVIGALLDGRVHLKHVTITHNHFKTITDHLGPQSRGRLVKLFASLESMEIYSCNEDDRVPLREFLDVIFDQCQLRLVLIRSHLDVVCSYLSKFSESYSLKRLNISLDVEKASNTHCKSCASLPDSFELIGRAIQCQKGLEEFEFNFSNVAASNLYETDFIQSAASLLFRPGFKVLTLGGKIFYGKISFDVLHDLLAQFFASPYPVTLNLSVSCFEYIPCQPLPAELQAHTEQNGKSLSLSCYRFFPNISSLVPRALVLKSLRVGATDWYSLQDFSYLESIVVERLSLSVSELINIYNINFVSSLLGIVNTKEWDLGLHLENNEEVLDKFMKILSDILFDARTLLLRLKGLTKERIVAIFETVFQSLLPSSEPYFELGFSCLSLDKECIKAILDAWARHGSIKLRKIEMLDGIDGSDEFIDILSEMTLDISLQKLYCGMAYF